MGYKWVTKNRCLTLNLPLFRAHISLETHIEFQLAFLFNSISIEKHLLRGFVVVQEQGLLSRLGMDDGLKPKGAPPDHAGAGLGPWTFRVGSVDSFGGGSFDWGRTSTQAPISS